MDRETGSVAEQISHAKVYYNNEGPSFCIVFNLEEFSSTELNKREGSSTDVDNITNELQERNVTTRVVTNCTESEMMNCLSELSGAEYNKYRCLMVIILSHGFYQKILSADGEKINVSKILHILNAENTPTFKNKPKIIIIHTCQQKDKSDKEGASNDELAPCIKERHFLLIFPALQNNPAYRHTERGTFYIQTFIKVMKIHGDSEDLLSMLTIVNRGLEVEVAAASEESNQTSSLTSTLTDKIYFRRRASELTRRSNSNCSVYSNGSFLMVGNPEPRRFLPQRSTATNIVCSQSRDASSARLLPSIEENQPVMGFKCNGDSSQIMNIPVINSESDDDSEEAEHSYITMNIPEQIEKRNESMPIEEELPTESPAKSHQPSEYQCITQAIQVSEATSTGDERKTESVKEVTLLAKTEAMPTFPPEVLNNEEPFLNTEGVDHEELSPTLFWDDTEVDKEKEEEKEQEQEREEEKEEERVEQARQQETVPHTPSIVYKGIFPDDNINATVPFYSSDQESQPIEQELPAETATEKSEQKWLDVSGDHDITPQGTPESEVTATLTKSIGNAKILKSKITEEGYIEIVNETKELTLGEIEDNWIVVDLS